MFFVFFNNGISELISKVDILEINDKRVCFCAYYLFHLHLSPPSAHLQTENCTSSNCLTFYGSEIVSLSLMDNDGASPCYVNLCDNETTEQPCCSTRGVMGEGW